MKREIHAVLLSTLMLGPASRGLWAQVKDNPYQDIVNRNAFALKPPPPPAPPGENTPPPSPVDVLLTGISTLGGTKKVLLQITDKSPGKNKTEFPPPLVEGDVQGRVEIVSINSDEGKVVIKIDGNEKTLSFDQDAPKAGGAAPNPAPAMIPGMIPGVQPAVNPAGTIPLPGVTTASGAAAALNAAGAPANPSSRGNNVLVGGGVPAAPAPSAPTVPGAIVPAPGVPTIPARPVRTYDSTGRVSVGGGNSPLIGSGVPTQVQPGMPMTREQAIAHIEELRRARATQPQQ